jgi:hypothetical protein
MRRIITILFFLALSACVAGPSLQTRMSAYIGATSQTLVQNLGVPDKQITVNGIQYLAYDRHRTEFSPGVYLGGFDDPYAGAFYGGGFYPMVFDSGIPPQVIEYSCETTFLLKDDHVFNFTLRGNDCAY